ncbi:MAG: hypothetical protein FJ115_02060 [Deltaproteobacteria bacterium]|nr:hypothetical protein [Deltaproteobacteria bacterium]MBM4322320.1 hypothetical protein [Deltaproteobacteria bacterium]
MKRYGVIDDLIKKEFGSFGRFCRESGIPKTTLSLLIRGKYGSDEQKVIKRVSGVLKELRPELDLSHIWDVSYTWYQKYLSEKSVVKNGFRIIVDVRMEEDGKLIIAPGVEGY